MSRRAAWISGSGRGRRPAMHACSPVFKIIRRTKPMKFPKVFSLIAGLCLPAAVAAYDEPNLIVTATRSEQERIYIPAAVAVISREEVLASGATHLAEVLRMQGGVQINDLYGDGSSASVSMRGFGETANANVLVLVDGRRLNNPDI